MTYGLFEFEIDFLKPWNFTSPWDIKRDFTIIYINLLTKMPSCAFFSSMARLACAIICEIFKYIINIDRCLKILKYLN